MLFQTEDSILFYISENLNNRYTFSGDVIGFKYEGNRDRGEIIADITSSFVVLLAIYFPSVTGTYEFFFFYLLGLIIIFIIFMYDFYICLVETHFYREIIF